MYCKKCGKFIGNDADLCDECKAQEEAVFGEFYDKTEEPRKPASTYSSTNTYGGGEIKLGKSIAAIILSNIGFTLVYMGLMIMSELAAYESFDFSGAMALMLVGCLPCVLGLILGIQSIAYFKSTSMIKSGKRVPVLILGIISVVMAGFGLFIALIMLMVYSMI